MTASQATLDENGFWALIEETQAVDKREHEHRLLARPVGMSPEGILDFNRWGYLARDRGYVLPDL